MRAIHEQQLDYEDMGACVAMWDNPAAYYEVRQQVLLGAVWRDGGGQSISIDGWQGWGDVVCEGEQQRRRAPSSPSQMP